MVGWVPGEVIENKQWCKDLFSMKIRSQPLNFLAGQFIKVGIEIDGKIIARPYSLVNANNDDILEIHFNHVKNGQLTPSLANLKSGDIVQISDKANGLLTLEEVPDVSYLWLFATGTGIGPFLSILKNKTSWQRFNKVILCYSVKSFEKLAYHHELKNLQSLYADKFSYIPITTQESSADIIHSRITVGLEEGEIEKQANVLLSANSSHIMLCGNAAMVQEVTSILESRGLRKHTRREPGHIATEKYY